MEHGTCNGGCDIVSTRRGEIDSTMSVGGKVVWAVERAAPTVRGESPHLSTMLIEFDQGVSVVAGDQQMPFAELDQSTGSAALFLPVLPDLATVPRLDIVSSVLD